VIVHKNYMCFKSIVFSHLLSLLIASTMQEVLFLIMVKQFFSSLCIISIVLMRYICSFILVNMQ